MRSRIENNYMALAKAKGISYDVLIREWVLEKIPYKLSLFVNQKVFGGIKAWIKQ